MVTRGDCTVVRERISMRWVMLLVLLGTLVSSSAEGPAEAYPGVPPAPGAGEFFHDLAGVVGEPQRERIREIQDETFQKAGVPIVVVTVPSMAQYDPPRVLMRRFSLDLIRLRQQHHGQTR